MPPGAAARRSRASFFDQIDDATWERLEEALILADAGAPTTAAVVERLEHEVEAGDRPRRRRRDARPADRDPRRGRLNRPGRSTSQRQSRGADDGRRQRHRQDDDDRQDRLAPLERTSASRSSWPPPTPTAPRPLSSSPPGPNERAPSWSAARPGADPGAVAFDAIAAARARGADVVIVDTAGRLHTQGNLMEELAKVRRVIAKLIPEAPHETLISIDATTGQNGLRQAKVFSEAVPSRRRRPDQARRHGKGRDRAGDRIRTRHPGEADRGGGDSSRTCARSTPATTPAPCSLSDAE